ncbi:MAG: hypothetical protein J6A62_06650 [Oscillospiraceae bacterium]|nr:hypothetical protein [Oscillospiraceae bacterium]
MIYFQDWNIRADGCVIARQYDNLTRTIAVSGDIPVGWDWVLLVQVGECLDILPLTVCEDGLSAALSAQQLAFSGYYSMQLRGTQGEMVRHSNIISVFVPKSLSGDEMWPVLPSEFTQMERRVAKAAAEAQGYTTHPPAIDEQGNWVLWDGSKYVDSGVSALGVEGPEGDRGVSGVYVGSGDMPEGCNVQIDPDGDAVTMEELVEQVLKELPVYNGEVEAV